MDSLKQLEEQPDSSVIHVSESRFHAVMQIKDNIPKIDKDLIQQASKNPNEDFTQQTSTNALEDPNQQDSTETTDIKTN